MPSEIKLLECSYCRQLIVFQTPLCPGCGQAGEWRATTRPALGRLFTYTTCYITGLNPDLKPPYSFGYIELDGGVQLYARLNREEQAADLAVGHPVLVEERPGRTSEEGTRNFFFSLVASKEIAGA